MAASNLPLYQACRSHILNQHRESLLIANYQTVQRLRDAGLTIIAVDRYSHLMVGILQQNSGCVCIPHNDGFDVVIDHSQIKALAQQLKLCPWQVIESALLHEYSHAYLASTLPGFAHIEPAAWAIAAVARSQCETVSLNAFKSVETYCLRK